MKKEIKIIKIKCIKSFCLDGGSMPILKNEEFWSIDDNYDKFRGDMQFSIYGEDNILELTPQHLEKYFSFCNTRTKYLK